MLIRQCAVCVGTRIPKVNKAVSENLLLFEGVSNVGLRELIRLLVNTPEHFHLEFNDKIRFRKLMNTRALKMVPVEELIFNPVSDEDRQ